ncbi:MAG: hypothetical protein BGO11_00380 [Solirubrobacterales bacterium 70-9]|nr:MAG: hypothetical protein BGO11_00380 [Solirubrobacterales bacterium 70-9]
MDAADLRQLETLSLAGVEAIVAGFGGQRSGAQRTRGLEFVDYRRYTPGDDLRSIDWNVYARLREVVVKAAPAEGHVDLALLLDGSRSMDDGTPSRFRYAQQLGAMLGTVALLGSDVVAVHMLADGRSWTGARLAAPHLVTELIEEVAGLPRGTRTDLAAGVRDYRRGAEPADLAVLLSDGLAEPRPLTEAIDELGASGRAAAFVHLVEGEAAMAALEGAFELEDRETGERLVVEVTPRVRATYEERVRSAGAALREACADRGVTYVPAPTDVPPLDLLFGAARDTGLVSL